MRTGFTPKLEELLRRRDSPLELILEACVVSRADVRQRKSQWDAADSLAGLTSRPEDGCLQLTAASGSLLSNATSNGEWASLDKRNGAFLAAELTLGDTDPAGIYFTTLTAYLDPINGGAKQVDRWELHLYSRYDTGLLGDGGQPLYQLIELSDPIQVSAGGAAGDVTFDFTGRTGAPFIKQLSALSVPVIVVEIRALKVDGSAAGNVGWGRDSTKASVGSPNTLRGTQWLPDSGNYTRSDIGQSPRMAFNYSTGLAAATVTFSGGGNQLDLGGTPTGTVEFVGQGYTPGASAITYQVQADDATWLTFTDGQTTDDLTRINPTHTIGKRQTYKMRATLTPNGGNNVTPLLAQLGVREITSYFFAHLLKAPAIEWSFDPITLKAQVTRGEFAILADGVRDYRSAVEDLLANNVMGTFDLRLWIGCLLGSDSHTEVVDAASRNDATKMLLPRSQWLLVETFLVEDTEAIDGGMKIVGVTPLALVKGRLPIYDVVNNKVSSLAYTAQSLAFCADDIISGQLALPKRYYGTALPDADLVTKTIQDSDAKTELDALAYAAGGAFISSQGQVAFQRIVDDPGLGSQGKAIVGLLPFEECAWGVVTPGFRLRLPEMFVNYGYDLTTGKFVGQYRAYDTTSLTKLGRALIDSQPQISDVIGQWCTGLIVTSITRSGSTVTVTTNVSHGYATGKLVNLWGADQAEYNGVYSITVTDATHFTYTIAGTPATPATGISLRCDSIAPSIGRRMVRALSLGMIQVAFESEYPHPEWEIGDAIAVQVDRFVLADPVTGAAIRGMNWAICVLMAQLDPWGRRWAAWVRNVSDILGSSAAAAKLGFALPQVLSIGLSMDSSGSVTAQVNGKAAKAIRWASSTSAYPSSATVAAGSLVALDVNGNATISAVAALTGTQVGYVGVIAYENTDGTGASSVLNQTAMSHGPSRMLDGSGHFAGQDSGGAFGMQAQEAGGSGTDQTAQANIFVPSTSTVKVGTVASPSSIAKVGARSDPSSFMIASDIESGAWTITGPGGGANFVYCRITDALSTLYAFIVLPKGVTITKVVAYLGRAGGVNDKAEAKFYRDATVLATLTQAASTAGEVSANISQLVGNEVYTWRLQIQRTAGGAASDGSCYYCRLEYSMPSYDKGL